jgi:hypothetical protein
MKALQMGGLLVRDHFELVVVITGVITKNLAGLIKQLAGTATLAWASGQACRPAWRPDSFVRLTTLRVRKSKATLAGLDCADLRGSVAVLNSALIES